MKRGDKVICVSVNGFEVDGRWKYPKLRGIYTIQEVLHDGAVTLEEIDNTYNDMYLLVNGINDRTAFYPWHFERLKSMIKVQEFSQKEFEPEKIKLKVNDTSDDQ